MVTLKPRSDMSQRSRNEVRSGSDVPNVDEAERRSVENSGSRIQLKHTRQVAVRVVLPAQRNLMSAERGDASHNRKQQKRLQNYVQLARSHMWQMRHCRRMWQRDVQRARGGSESDLTRVRRQRAMLQGYLLQGCLLWWQRWPGSKRRRTSRGWSNWT